MSTPTDQQFLQLCKDVAKLVENNEMIRILRQSKEDALNGELSTRSIPSQPSMASVMSGRETPASQFTIIMFLDLRTRERAFLELSYQIERLWNRTIRLRQCVIPSSGTFSRTIFEGLKPKSAQDFSDYNQLASQAHLYLEITKSIIYIMKGVLDTE